MQLNLKLLFYKLPQGDDMVKVGKNPPKSGIRRWI